MKLLDNPVLKSLVDMVEGFQSLKAKMEQIETKLNNLSYTDTKTQTPATPSPTPSITNLVTSIMPKASNETVEYWIAARDKHDAVVLWIGGVVTTISENGHHNPLAVFSTRNKAIFRLRKAGWNVNTKNEYFSQIVPTPKFYIAKNK